MQLKNLQSHIGNLGMSTRKHRYFPTCYLSGSRIMRRFATRIQIVNLMLFSHLGLRNP